MTALGDVARHGTELLAALGSTMLLATVEVALLHVLVSLLERTIGLHGSVMRRSARNAVLLVALLVPVTSVHPRLQLGLPLGRAPAWLARELVVAGPRTIAASPPLGRRVTRAAPALAPLRPILPGLVLAALLVWLAGAGVFVCRLLGAHGRARAIRHHARPSIDQALAGAFESCRARLGVTSSVELLLSDDVDMPFACGVVHPAVVLPSDAREWDTPTRDAVLLHELAHVRRRDVLWRMVAELACAVHWPNPVVWRAARRAADASELAADASAIVAGVRPSDYATALLALGGFDPQPHSTFGHPAFARRAALHARILVLLDERNDSRRAGGDARMMSTVVFLGAVTIAGLRFRAVPDAAPLLPVRSTRLVATLAKPLSAASAPMPAAQRRRADESSVRPQRTDRRAADPAREATGDSVDVVGALIAALPDSSPQVRAAVLQSLRRLGDGRARSAVTAALTDANPIVRDEARRALEAFSPATPSGGSPIR